MATGSCTVFAFIGVSASVGDRLPAKSIRVLVEEMSAGGASGSLKKWLLGGSSMFAVLVVALNVAAVCAGRLGSAQPDNQRAEMAATQMSVLANSSLFAEVDSTGMYGMVWSWGRDK